MVGLIWVVLFWVWVWDDEKETEREKRHGREERVGSFIFILLGILYYFISMYVK